ncbi:MAG: outer membrane protein assembly factor [Bacteroidia bacterium]
MRLSALWLLMLANSISFVFAQDSIPEPVTRYIKHIKVTGTDFSEQQAIRNLSGLGYGYVRIPGLQISDAMKRIWQEQIFSDVQITAEPLQGDSIILHIKVEESMRLASYQILNLNKRHTDALKELLALKLGAHFTQSQALSVKRMVRNYFVDKGYYHCEVEIDTQRDKLLKSGLNVKIKVDKGDKIRITQLQIADGGVLTPKEKRRVIQPLSQFEWWKVWQSSRLVPKEYDLARKQLLRAYHGKGLLDAALLNDTIIELPDGNLALRFEVDAGQQYYLRNVSWNGNQVYETETLEAILNLQKGSKFDQGVLEERIYGNPEGLDLSSLYLDRGYLFFQANSVITPVGNDSVDLEIWIQEGVPAYIRDVYISGNTRTADHVIFRELETEAGDLFSRSDIIRSQRKLAMLNYFDPEGFNIVPHQDPKSGAVDLEYVVEEKSSDQFQFRGSWAPKVFDTNDNLISGGLTGTFMLVLNNFSTKRLLEKEAWKPFPGGDGQQLSLAVQSNGQSYTNFGVTFQEPWLGGKKPNLLGFSTNYVLYNALLGENDSESEFKSKAFSSSLDFGTRLNIPDDFTRYYASLSYRYYDIENPASLYPVFEGIDNAFINIISLDQEIRRTTLDDASFPTSGSDFSFKLSVTPPYSLFSNDETEAANAADTYNLLEYHKWRFKGDIYQPLTLDKSLVLRLHAEAGYVGSYGDGPASPFERFSMGGYGINAAANGGFMGIDLVPLRGYAPQVFDNDDANYPLYQRISAEIRYKVPLPQSYPLWLLGFVEAGNGYNSFKEFDPYDLKRSAGLGFRTNVPYIGLFGLDWGYGFDKVNPTDDKVSGHQFHLILGREF